MVRGKDTAFQNVSSMIDYPRKKKDGSNLRDVPWLAAYIKQFFKPPSLYQASCPKPFWSIITPACPPPPSTPHPQPEAQPHPASPRGTCQHSGLPALQCLGCDKWPSRALLCSTAWDVRHPLPARGWWHIQLNPPSPSASLGPQP